MDANRKLFDDIKEDLIRVKALPEGSVDLVYPDKQDEIPTKFLMAGVNVEALAESFSRVMGWPVYDVEKHGMAQKSSGDGSWLWIPGILFVVNPFAIPPARLILSGEKITDLSYGLLQWQQEASAGSSVDEEKLTDEKITEARRKVEQWLHEAMRDGATDVHFIPANSTEVAILHRVDSRLAVVREWQASEGLRYEYICNVLLGMANQQSGVFGQTVDGRIHTKIGGVGVELRLSMRPAALPDGPAMPAVFLRLPGRSGKRAINLEKLDVLPDQLEKLKRMAKSSSGISVFTGPTGSGKTTTLYALLAEIKSKFPHRSIQTLEDPVEQNIRGIVQTQIHEEAGLGFAEGLRSLMRTDVDCILLGEVRDSVTASQCLSACLTGHYLLTTLHAPSAIGAVDRLMDLGVDLRLLASWLQFVSAQRLVRRVCPHCSSEVDLGDYYTVGEGSILTERTKVRIASQRGCSKCDRGYQGLVLLLEIVEISGELRDLIRGGASAHELEKRAHAEGNLLLSEYAQRIVLAGKTTISAIEEEGGLTLATQKENQPNFIHSQGGKPCTSKENRGVTAALH